jgi:cell division protein FtsI/penicillin-binding protein 2
VTVTPGALTVKDGRATGSLGVAWQIPAIGRFAYSSPIAVVKAGGRWLVHFSPRTIFPRLTATTRLGTEGTTPTRASILDRDGHPLTLQRAVVEVGVERDKLTDVQASASALAKALGIGAAAYVKQVRGAGPRQFVVAQTLRAADYAAKRAALARIPGLQTVRTTAPLTPTRSFARALIGAVGPATAEEVAASKGRFAPGQQVGQWGLAQAFDDRLAGAPARRILIRETKGGAPVRTVRSLPGRAPRTSRPAPMR